jgi:hypothetical protein
MGYFETSHCYLRIEIRYMNESDHVSQIILSRF